MSSKFPAHIPFPSAHPTYVRSPLQGPSPPSCDSPGPLALGPPPPSAAASVGGWVVVTWVERRRRGGGFLSNHSYGEGGERGKRSTRQFSFFLLREKIGGRDKIRSRRESHLDAILLLLPVCSHVPKLRPTLPDINKIEFDAWMAFFSRNSGKILMNCIVHCYSVYCM